MNSVKIDNDKPPLPDRAATRPAFPQSPEESKKHLNVQQKAVSKKPGR